MDFMDPTDSWDLHSVERTDSMSLLRQKVSEMDLGAAPSELPPLRKTKSVSIGAQRECQEHGVQRRRVGFSPCFLNSAHKVTAYATQYGVHPNFFNFGRRGEMRLADSGIAEERRRKEEGLGPLMLDGNE